MKRKQKALLLSAICSLAVLTGCNNTTQSSEKIEPKNGFYVSVPNDLELQKKIFEPGEHIIYYEQDDVDRSLSASDEDSWTSGILEIPETPEGYYLFQIVPHYASNRLVGVIYVYINDQTVEATPTYDRISKTIQYETPGVVVDTIKLSK